MKNQRGSILAAAIIGVAAALSLALTTDQIMQRVYDAANTALRVNVVTGGGGGGAATDVTSGTTTITGGTDNSIVRNNGGVFAADGVGLLDDAGKMTLLGPAIVPAGAEGTPTFANSSAPTTGLWFNGGAQPTFSIAGAAGFTLVGSQGARLNGSALPCLGWTTGSAVATGNDTEFCRESARVIQAGPDAATALAYTLKGSDSTGSTITGGSLTLQGGAGTSGVANGGALILAGGAKSSTGEPGAVAISDGGTKPTCAVGIRGSLWYDAGAGGVADTFETCRKSTADTYSWAESSGGGSAKPFISWSANQMLLPASSYPQFGTAGTGHPVLLYDAAADECAYVEGILPTGYAGGGLKVRIDWWSSTETSGATGWLTAFERLSSANSLTADSFGTEKSASTTVTGTANGVTQTSITHASGAEIDSLAAGEGYRARVCRDGNGSTVTDSMTGDAGVVHVSVEEP